MESIKLHLVVFFAKDIEDDLIKMMGIGTEPGVDGLYGNLSRLCLWETEYSCGNGAKGDAFDLPDLIRQIQAGLITGSQLSFLLLCRVRFCGHNGTHRVQNIAGFINHLWSRQLFH